MERFTKRGTADEVSQALVERADRQKQIDTGNSFTQGVVDGHQKNFKVAQATLSAARETLGDTDAVFEVTLEGSNNGRGTAIIEVQVRRWPAVAPVQDDTPVADESEAIAG